MTREPNVVVEQVMHGLQVASRKRLCVFVDGQLDTEDPHVIEKLKERPDLFWIGREDINYRALAYPQLIAEAERLGIETYKVNKRDLLKALIHFDKDRELPRASKVVEKTKSKEEEIAEIEVGLEEPIEEIKEKEVIENEL